MKANVIFIKKHADNTKQVWLIEKDGIRQWCKVEKPEVYEYGVKAYKENDIIEMEYEVKPDKLTYISFAKLVTGNQEVKEEAKETQITTPVKEVECINEKGAYNPPPKNAVRPEKPTPPPPQKQPAGYNPPPKELGERPNPTPTPPQSRKVVSSYDYNEGQRRGCILNNVAAVISTFEGQLDINDLSVLKSIAKDLFVFFYDLSGADVEQLRKELNNGLTEVK